MVSDSAAVDFGWDISSRDALERVGRAAKPGPGALLLFDVYTALIRSFFRGALPLLSLSTQCLDIVAAE